ncbi:helix-turn-helix domain-containing protein [Fulvivirga kasyanovii]|uniref:Helix-turn-helix domain-containing protein n=1 Tax=Fulvivirga kasyanovii TaxID=396812 RepID=A0ABW9RNY7_9BACT|nr:helix-turn-helix domain-containing protein [Fulvivirga kasyanovii]MTI25844.1 helix-turn-helix domain-containing protein [Fulvivirga kasyanovii]
MKNISILVPESAVMEAVADPRYLFTAVNQFLQAAGKKPLFEVQLVGQSKEVSFLGGVYSVRADKTLNEVTKTDMIIIPALFGDLQLAVEQNREAIPWIIEHYNKGAEVASLCLGAFLLASTGLLDGKKCSTHWAFYNQFRETFPEVEVVDGGIITEENGIYSSGGANSYWNLLLYLVEKYVDRDTAILAAKYFAIDIDRESQAAFTIFSGQKDHNDEDVKKGQEYIEKNYQEKIAIDDLVSILGVSRRSFERRFKKATNNTIAEYMQRVKVEAAKRDFELSRKNINEVMYDVGYSDSKAFRNLFKRLTGLTPVEYRNKYNKEVELPV